MHGVRARTRHAIVLGLACFTAAAIPSVTRAQSAPPRLVVLISIDQLRADRATSALPGGIGRLMREGRVFADAAHAHADTETCPGHAVMLTAMHPGRAGIPSNEWIDRDSGRTVYCVEDASPEGQVIGAPPDGAGAATSAGAPAKSPSGRSPRSLRADALGDWMKERWPAAKVFAVSAKDRAAIALGGRHPDAAYWLDRGAQGFTTSRWYRAALPDWIERWHGDGEGQGRFLAKLPERWEHESGVPANGARPDDGTAESPQFSRTSGHPVRGSDRRSTLERVAFTPWLDSITIDFARTLVDAESLGRDEAPDLLALSLSATDLIGHLYGPGSQEARDALARLDRELGALLDRLERVVGKSRLLVALTADHGVLELPEWLQESGQSACPLPGGRQLATPLRESLARGLAAALGEPPSDSPWVFDAGLSLTVNRALAAARGVDVSRVVEAARAFFAVHPGVARTWTPEEIAAARERDPVAGLQARSFDPERSGDLIVEPRPDCLFSPFPFGTSHGSPWLYDRAVPLVLRGPGVMPGIVRGRAAPVDLAPTLAGLLGLAVPVDRDGRPLPLRD